MQGLHYNPWFVMVLGMGTVFVGLICLIYISKLMSFLCRRKAAPLAQIAPVTVPVGLTPAAVPILNRPQFVAAVASAIAVQMGTEPGGLRIHSIRPVGEAQDRGQLIAAVSAAISTQMGEQVAGIRIHSVRKV